MSKLTDLEIVKALKAGNMITLMNTLEVKEVFHNASGCLYAHKKGEKFWTPYQPTLYDLENENWQLEPFLTR